VEEVPHFGPVGAVPHDVPTLHIHPVPAQLLGITGCYLCHKFGQSVHVCDVLQFLCEDLHSTQGGQVQGQGQLIAPVTL